MVMRTLVGRGLFAPHTPFSLPPGERAYAIGDVHGRLDLLDRIMAKIDADHAARGKADCWLIFLGDLIDRGPESSGVSARAMELAASARNCIFLMGNHEEMLIRIWTGDDRPAPSFMRYGGDALLRSYGCDVPPLAEDLPPAEIMALVQRHVPRAHIAFLRKFGSICQIGSYVFVHAGLRPGIALGDQDPIDMRWIRSDFTASDADFGVMVVHGHTITKAPVIRANRIGIDTGAYASDRLTALGLQGTDRWFLATEPA